MSSNPPKRTGGEYGTVRASIDVDKLNAYLVIHVPSVSTPVDVQQFKVCACLSPPSRPVFDPLFSLDRYA